MGKDGGGGDGYDPHNYSREYALKKRIAEAEDVILGFTEYFNELKKGKYSATRQNIRVYELILLGHAETYIEKHNLRKI